jgi:hypothetical protein
MIKTFQHRLGTDEKGVIVLSALQQVIAGDATGLAPLDADTPFRRSLPGTYYGIGNDPCRDYPVRQELLAGIPDRFEFFCGKASHFFLRITCNKIVYRCRRKRLLTYKKRHAIIVPQNNVVMHRYGTL